MTQLRARRNDLRIATSNLLTSAVQAVIEAHVMLHELHRLDDHMLDTVDEAVSEMNAVIDAALLRQADAPDASKECA